MKKELLALGIIVLLLAVTFIVYIGEKKEEGKTLVIQELIDAASPGDTIIIPSGIYHENILINKSITIFGENDKTTIIDGSEKGDVVNISANNVNIGRFTIQNGRTIQTGEYTLAEKFGIKVYGSNTTISDCQILNNDMGVWLSWMITTHNNEISNCTISNNVDGLFIDGSNNNIVSNCNISLNLMEGLTLSSAENNIISNCKIHSNSYVGVTFMDFSNNNLFSNCNISDNGGKGGIYFAHSSNNTITNCSIYSNNCSYVIHGSGIMLSANSNNNKLFCNIFVDNKSFNLIRNAYDDCNNSWYNDLLKKGNYWSDYSGSDNNGDGIGDTSYIIKGGNNLDLYPLMNPIKI